MMRLTDKVALVTGSGKGIGRAIAVALAREGCNVVINDIDVESIGSGVEEIKGMGRRSISIAADVSNQQGVTVMVDRCVQTFGRIDILVNNAGGALGTPGKIGDVTEAHWDLVVDSNLKGTFLCTQAALKYMKEQKSGSIVNISSVAGRVGELYSRAHYSAAKAGILGLTRHVAKEVGPYGIRINSICPGHIMSGPRVEKRWQEMRETGKADAMLEQIALRRIGTPEDVAGVVVFLCSDEASYITGATIDVNGGFVTL